MEHLAVALQRGRSTMFTIAKLHKDVRLGDGMVARYDEIYCFAYDQATRNKWIWIFRRMAGPIFDERTERFRCVAGY